MYSVYETKSKSSFWNTFSLIRTSTAEEAIPSQPVDIVSKIKPNKDAEKICGCNFHKVDYEEIIIES